MIKFKFHYKLLRKPSVVVLRELKLSVSFQKSKLRNIFRNFLYHFLLALISIKLLCVAYKSLEVFFM
jgi:hypothetical protein